MTPHHFISELQSVQLDNVFNPYLDYCSKFDKIDAPRKRSASLRRLLLATQDQEIDMLWIGRDLGYRGGRRTGLAFTDDVHLVDHGNRWRLNFQRPTVGEFVSEMTATFVWRVLNQTDSTIFLWNIFPFHPHLENNPFSNRKHNGIERRIGEEILAELISFLRPRRLIPIGSDAAAATGKLCEHSKICPVRHPSFGGYPKFRDQMSEIYKTLK